jgi:ribonuclease HII
MKIQKPTFEEEALLWQKGIDHVIGLDEVGRGAFAGPLVAAGVVFSPFAAVSPEIHDSKLLSAAKREELSAVIRKQALSFAVVEISVAQIDRYGVGKANFAAFRKIVRQIKKQLADTNVFVLVDGFPVEQFKKTQQKAIIKGDRKSISIAAASILAKVYRDNLMATLGEQFVEYNWQLNKGYGTLAHRQAIETYGLSRLHRSTFCTKYHPLQ